MRRGSATPRGEFELIAALRERIEHAGDRRANSLVLGSGDDAAISVREGATVTSVDALVEGVHFRMPPFAPADVGHKALATALSDIAAMGARPEEAFVQLGVPEDLPGEALLELAEGLGELAAEHGIAVPGGDLTRAPALFVALTVVGVSADAEAAVRRDGARPGDAVVVTGSLGGAAAGLLLLEGQEEEAGIAADLAARVRDRQRRPSPRIAGGRALAQAGATAMIDLSDGLAGDAEHLASASAVEVRIELDALPLEPGLVELGEAWLRDPLELALTGGEDYELLATLPPEAVAGAEEALKGTDSPLSVIGEVGPGAGVVFSEADGGKARRGQAFDHLRPRRAPVDPA